MNASDRHEEAGYRGMPGHRLGTSGVTIPRISLGCWNNFGADADDDLCKELVFAAFDRGVTHFDLANNYGPPPGSAEERFGKILKHLPRDEVVISTKAGYLMWDGPYGNWGSRKHLLASLDQSLGRLQVEYVDVFYHHRPDPETRLDETMGALDSAVRMGKALYAGVSNYGAGMGVVAYSPLAQGLLTNRYLNGIPAGSRAGKEHDYSGALTSRQVTEEVLAKVRALREVALRRGQSLAQLAIAWTIRERKGGQTAGAIIGASSVEQLVDSLSAAHGPVLSEVELEEIDRICR